MPVTFPKGQEPAVLSENPNGPRDENPKEKPLAQDFQSPGPVITNEMPPVASKEELKKRDAELNAATDDKA